MQPQQRVRSRATRDRALENGNLLVSKGLVCGLRQCLLAFFLCLSALVRGVRLCALCALVQNAQFIAV